ncbi:MAG: hypothetical protein WAN50_01800 [Minisyncoccia bacterium]
MKTLEDFFASKKVRLTAIVFGGIILAFLIFHAGVEIGEHGGEFDRRGPDRDFRHPLLPGVALPHEFIQNGHGAVGTITNVSLPTLTVSTPDGRNETILVSSSTMVRSIDGPATQHFSVGSQIVVLGEPDNQNRIDATFIRILPATTTP